MVTFNNNSYIIEIKSSTPVEDWQNLHKGLCEVVGHCNPDILASDTCNVWNVIELINHLMPEIKTAEMMLQKTRNLTNKES